MSPDSESTPLLAASPSEPPATKRSTLSHVLSRVTVEPALLLHAFAKAVDQGLLENLTVDKLCSVHFSFDAETCRNLDAGNHTAEQDQVQRLASAYNTYIHWAEYLPALVTSFLLGCLGDARGRRLPVIITFVGSLLTGLCFLANVYWWWLPTPLLYLSMVPVGVAGGYIGVFTTTNAYLSAMTKVRSRTISLSIVEWVKYSAYPLGMFLASVLYARGGYVLVYCFFVLAILIAILYLLFCVGEPPTTSSEDTAQRPFVGVGVKGGVKVRLQKTLSVPGMLRRSGRPGVLVAAHTAVVVLWSVTRGTKTQFFLYDRKVFGWEYQQFNAWLIYDYVMKATGILLVMPTFSYYRRVQDTMLGFVGGVSMLFFYTILGTAPVAWVLYLASAFSLCSTIPVIASRATISKNVAPTDLGAVFALLAVLECGVELVAPPLYTLIYTQTLDIFPGTLFLVMAGVSVVICCVYVWLLTYYEEPRGSSTN